MSDTVFRGKRIKYSYIVSISGAGLMRTKTNNRVNYPQQQEFRKRLMVYSGKEMVFDFIGTRHTKNKISVPSFLCSDLSGCRHDSALHKYIPRAWWLRQAIIYMPDSRWSGCTLRHGSDLHSRHRIWIFTGCLRSFNKYLFFNFNSQYQGII